MSDPAFILQSTHETVAATGRVKNDAYFTPIALAHAAVGWLIRDGYLWKGASILEPSAGRGSWIEAVQPFTPQYLTAVDIDPERVADLNARFPGLEAEENDFATMEWPEAASGYDLIVGNPPYNAAEKHTKAALDLRARFGSVAFLLRLAFLESFERIEFWKEHPASKIYVLSERPSFSGGKTDNAAYGVFVWCTWHRGPTQIEVAQWKIAASGEPA